MPFQLNSGDTLLEGRFEIRDNLGRGSLGSVYRVFDKQSKMDLALKVIVAPEGLETDIVNRIAEIMKATEAIKNPGDVLKILDDALHSRANVWFADERDPQMIIQVDAVGKVRAGHLTDGRHAPCIIPMSPLHPPKGEFPTTRPRRGKGHASP